MQNFDENVWYTIAAKAGGKVIEIENASADNGAKVCLAEATGADQQLWSIVHIDGKYYKIINKNSGKALDIINMGVVNGANLHRCGSLRKRQRVLFASSPLCPQSALTLWA